MEMEMTHRVLQVRRAVRDRVGGLLAWARPALALHGRRVAALLLVALLLAGAPGDAVAAGGITLGPRVELRHPASGHEAHVSSPALAVAADGVPIVAWAAAQHGAGNQLYVARMSGDPVAARANPPELAVDALHHSPRIAVASGGDVYLSWSSAKPKPEGALFASDLRLSRSSDGGRTFAGHVRVNDDRALSHSFDGLAVAPDGTVLVSWLDSRAGGPNARAYLARVSDRGARVDGIVEVGADACVCCRLDLAPAPKDTVAVLWRRVFPGDIRDMVLSTSRDGGRTFADASLVHDDRWRITACPHRGGALGVDGRGRAYASWYTEGRDGRPDLYFATSDDGRRFGPRRRLHTSTTSIPDHARMAVDRDGRAAIVWEDATAVRRQVLLRYTADGGRTLSRVHTLSSSIKAWGPDIAVGRDGSFVAAWHEERFPSLTTVVQSVRIDGPRAQ
jgi:hypothetical protein